MQVKAAVVRKKGGPFEIQEVTLEEPAEDQVLVRVVAAGICHTDLMVRDQQYPPAPPVILGHEGAGIIEKVGRGVKTLAPGQKVILTYVHCGGCRSCQVGRPWSCERMLELNFGGKNIDGRCLVRDGNGPIASSFFGQSSFAAYAIANELNCVKVESDVPLELLGPLGCGIQTGAGAVLNALGMPPGDTVAVFGAGAVGLSAVMAAVIAAATRIISIDVRPKRLELARQLGATDVIDASRLNPVEELTRIVPGGVPYVVETSGNPTALKQAIGASAQGGTVAVVGAPPLGTEISVDVNHLLFNRRLRYYRRPQQSIYLHTKIG